MSSPRHSRCGGRPCSPATKRPSRRSTAPDNCLRLPGVVDLDLGRPEGRQAGDLHPAVVVTAQRILDASPTVIQVVPLTSTLRGFQTEVAIDPDPTNGLVQPSAAQCQHVRAVSPARVVDTVGNVGPQALSQIRETIAVIIDLP